MTVLNVQVDLLQNVLHAVGVPSFLVENVYSNVHQTSINLIVFVSNVLKDVLNVRALPTVQHVVKDIKCICLNAMTVVLMELINLVLVVIIVLNNSVLNAKMHLHVLCAKMLTYLTMNVSVNVLKTIMLLMINASNIKHQLNVKLLCIMGNVWMYALLALIQIIKFVNLVHSPVYHANQILPVSTVYLLISFIIINVYQSVLQAM